MTHSTTGFRVLLLAAAMSVFPMAANAQTVQVQDISVQLQSSLEANAPTVVYFNFDKDSITPDAEAALLQQASWLSQNPEAKVNLSGHTDAVGSNAYNDDLAMRRANSVNDFMLMHGVNQNQMQSVVSRGESELAISTQKRERLNRRVTTYVTGLVELVTAPSPPPPPPPQVPLPVRNYVDNSAPVCDGRSRTPLLDMESMKTLQTELSTRMMDAENRYTSQSVQDSTSAVYSLASYTKVQCGIAIGYTKKGITDERSISNCDCSSSLLGASTL